jgi:hypothetical protein
MANTLTIQLRPTKKYDPPDVKNLFHNTGISKATYWLKDSSSIISNINLKNLTSKKVIDLWNKWEEEATNLVIKNKGKNPQKKQVLIEEGLMVIGRDIKVENEEDLIKIFNEFKKFFEEKYNTKILAYFYHNHEGHIDGDSGEFIPNRHIHFFFKNVDTKGNSVRRQIKKTDLSNFQTKIYKIGKKYIPNLERAINYKKLGLKAPKHIPHREYRTKKIKEEFLPKLVKKIEENKELKKELAKVKDLKEENKKLRALLKELGAKRDDYAYLENYVKKIKEFIKKKELTKEELKKKIEEIKEKVKQRIAEKEKIILEQKKQLDFFNKKIEIIEGQFTIRNKKNSLRYRIDNFLEELKRKKDIIDFEKIDEKTTIIQTPYSEIVDTQDRIELKTALIKNEDKNYNKSILQNEVKIMIDLALKKGWKLEKIKASGSKEFIEAVNKEISKRLKRIKEYNYSANFSFKI